MRLINIVMNALVPVVYISNRFINPTDAKIFVETGVGKGIIFGVVIACSISLYLGKKITEHKGVQKWDLALLFVGYEDCHRLYSWEFLPNKRRNHIKQGY